MAIAVSCINMKGGVGKTTLAAQIAYSADNKGFKTLAVDLDPQANLSQHFLTPEKYARHFEEKKPTIVQIFERPSLLCDDHHQEPRRVDARGTIIKGVGIRHESTLDLIPSHLKLSHTLKNPTGTERKLAKALAKVNDEYDLIIIDCAPTESILTEIAYFASRYALVPVKPEFMATIGLPLLYRSIEDFTSENEEREFGICGIVFNDSSSYVPTSENRQAIQDVKELAKKHGWHVYDTHISYSATYAKSSREGRPIEYTSHAHPNTISTFEEFCEEFFDSVGLAQKE